MSCNPLSLVEHLLKAGASVEVTGDDLIVAAREDVLTPEALAALRCHKPTLLPVLARLQAMRAHGVDLTGAAEGPPVPVAVWPELVGGPGRCFSCGAGLDSPSAYGRCEPCALAAELFYRTRPDVGESTP
jgi:hypothetical protein